MIRTRTLVPLPILLLALALAGCGGGSDNGTSGDQTRTAETTQQSSATGGDSGQTLNGSVGPGFVISLAGTENLTAGDYTLVVDDRASIHNFHLTGPGGVDAATDIVEEGKKSFEITLVPGTYTYVCDPHSSSMNGTFTVS